MSHWRREFSRAIDEKNFTERHADIAIYLINWPDREPGNVVNAISLEKRSFSSESLLSAGN